MTPQIFPTNNRGKQLIPTHQFEFHNKHITTEQVHRISGITALTGRKENMHSNIFGCSPSFW